MANLFDQIPKDGYPKAPTADGSQNNPLNTEVGRNLSNLASAIPGAAGVPGAVAMGTGLAARALGASAPAVGLSGRAFQAAAPYAPVAAGAVALNAATSDSSAPPQAAPTPAQQPSGNSPVGMSVADAQKQGLVGERVGYDPAYDQRLSMGTQTAQPTASALPTASAPAPSAQPAGNEIAPGVYRNAPGQYSDNAQGMNMPAGFTGRPNPQNMAAAANLAASTQAPSGRSLAEAALSQPSSVQAPTVRNSTNDWAARKALENAATAASSITANGSAWDKTGRGDSPAQAAYKAALATDQALQQAQPGADITAMRENAGIQREGMQQSGATTRAGMQERGAMGRTMAQAALEQQKINQAGESQGFANRAAAQSEQLRNVLLDPKSTPEQRAVAQRNLSALSGKTAADRMQTVTLPDTTNEMGQVVRGGQALVRTLEDGTVQQVPIGTQRGATAPLANHVAALKANPKQAAQFDEIYGPGAAARAIGK